MNTAKIVAVTEPRIVSADSTFPQYQPVEYLKVDEFVAYVARVSNPANQDNKMTASKLLRYLVRNKHWSPFEMVNVVMEIETTRDIGRQILRHRSFSYQEFSQRYADPTQLGLMTREARLQDTKNRQNSIEPEEDWHNTPVWERLQNSVASEAIKVYNWAINNGIAKEQARVVLPEGMTLSRMYMNGTLRSWIHYCQLRTSNGTQKEHRAVAVMAWQEILKVFPSLSELEIGM